AVHAVAGHREAPSILNAPPGEKNGPRRCWFRLHKDTLLPPYFAARTRGSSVRVPFVAGRIPARLPASGLTMEGWL
ncbi:hypothetical protein, partial [Parvibaculum sp.]|uniref:hypothetical protein n=1 Tax=Parvibaculum sp. TaxID=2024848 RepID=UPI0027337ACC